MACIEMNQNVPKRVLKKSLSPGLLREKAIKKFLASSEESRKQFLFKFREINQADKCNLLREFIDDATMRSFGIKSIEDNLDWSSLVESTELEEAVIEIEQAIHDENDLFLGAVSWDEYFDPKDDDDPFLITEDVADDNDSEGDIIICPVCRQNSMLYCDTAHTLCCECGVIISLKLPLSSLTTPFSSPHCFQYCNLNQEQDVAHDIYLTVSQFKQMLSEVFDRHTEYCMQIQQQEYDGHSSCNTLWENNLQYHIHETGLIASCAVCEYYERLL